MTGYRFCPRCGSGLVARDTGGVSRPACPVEACGFVVWDNPVPVIAAIVETAGQIVLARNVAWPEKVFGLVTGYRGFGCLVALEVAGHQPEYLFRPGDVAGENDAPGSLDDGRDYRHRVVPGDEAAGLGRACRARHAARVTSGQSASALRAEAIAVHRPQCNLGFSEPRL